VRGETRTVSRPYYDFFLRSFGLPLLLLMGIGPLVAWRRTSLRTLGRSFTIPALVALVTGAALVAAGAGSSRPGLIAYTFSAFVAASILLEFQRGTRARRSLGDSNWPLAFARLVGRNRRRYGGYVVHAAVVLLAIGVAGSSAYQTERERKLAAGQSMAIRGYRLDYRSLATRTTHNSREVRALVDVYRGGSYVGQIEPGKNVYFPVAGLFSNEVAIRSNWLTGEDLYVVADQINGDGSIYFKVWVKPLVNLIWLGGIVFVLGSLVAMWPDAIEQRRLAERYADVRAKVAFTAAGGRA
jgi:cytochrome c-type biogenesis protein CcmF